MTLPGKVIEPHLFQPVSTGPVFLGRFVNRCLANFCQCRSMTEVFRNSVISGR